MPQMRLFDRLITFIRNELQSIKTLLYNRPITRKTNEVTMVTITFQFVSRCFSNDKAIIVSWKNGGHYSTARCSEIIEL